MSLLLLAPLFLLGLGTLVVPVIVHLIHRHKRESVPFPSLMFIQRIPYKDVRRQQLRHKLLFALRCLALILLALAFARPFLENATEATATDIAGREVVILLDRSHSMRFGDRWQRAVEQARARLDILGPLDRATVVLFAETAEATRESTTDVLSLKNAIERAEPTAGATRYGSALQLAGRILSESEQPEREVVFITDFQRSGWDRVSDVRLPSGTTVTSVDLSEDETDNISLPFVSLRQEVLSGREWVSVTTRIVNGGERQVRGLRVALILNGQELQSRTVTVDPRGSTAVTFSPVLLPQGVSRGAVTAGTDALPQDNTATASAVARGRCSVGCRDPPHPPSLQLGEEGCESGWHKIVLLSSGRVPLGAELEYGGWGLGARGSAGRSATRAVRTRPARRGHLRYARRTQSRVSLSLSRSQCCLRRRRP